MYQPLTDPSWQLPDEAVPLLRELVLEVSRRVPRALGLPLRFEPSQLVDAAGCLSACRDLLSWLDEAPGALGQTMEDFDHLFLSLGDGIQEIDGRLHRAVLQVRGWMEEELVFSRSVHDVLRRLRGAVAACPGQPQGPTLIAQVIQQIEAKEGRDQVEALSLSAHFERVQEDLRALRERVAVVEIRTRRLLDESLRDALTGLWSRKAFEGRLAEELSRCRRYESSLGLVVWDLDRFTEVNRLHGHAAGDLALQTLAGRALRLLRCSDFVARLGGEEFAVLLPATPLPQACAVAEKIRAAAEASPVPAGGGLTVTLSLGAAQAEPGDTAETLLCRAEDAMRRAKAGGRNRVEPSRGAQAVGVPNGSPSDG